MTLQSGGPIWLSQIRDEFGGGNPIWLSNYRPGGPYVPAGTAGIYGAIPASGPITLAHFLGSSKAYTITVFAAQVADKYGTSIGYVPGALGAISDSTFDPLGGPNIESLSHYNLTNWLTFQVTGSYGNGGWNNMAINGSNFSRASATYTNGGVYTSWYWAVGSPFVVNANNSVVFT
jgi:hypothetical protein